MYTVILGPQSNYVDYLEKGFKGALHGGRCCADLDDNTLPQNASCTALPLPPSRRTPCTSGTASTAYMIVEGGDKDASRISVDQQLAKICLVLVWHTSRGLAHRNRDRATA